ncbi:hypothetical protein LOD99_998 [Oopsacas minuta]|uniref:Nbr1 FW domain-containing protein n=1 Tax=Oopsacas minuta TaxID=111878 RepID=A0AAV7K050_9METZ|nr:hypothetical protein LOD99_998 [Oopsacas minuta]
MEVDDLEQQLLSQFRSLATSDRDVLITQFQKLIDGQMTDRGCEFFLDMTNWNLQAAACAYYDYQGHNQSLPEMSLVEDVTIGEGESITPSTPFSKVWRLQNRGCEAWPPGCSINFCLGHKFGGIDYLPLPTLEPLEVTEVRVCMVSPPESGIFSGQWRMKTAAGNICGGL